MKAENIHIRQFTIDDWEAFRDMRLQALKECTRMYLATYEDSLKRTDQEWRNMISGPNKTVFGLFDGDQQIGFAGIFMPDEGPSDTAACLVMDYIVPEYRGKGLVQMLYRARIEWAQNHPVIDTLNICHRAGNEASRKAMVAQGFKPNEQKQTIFGDGQEDTDYGYVLYLQK